MESGDLAGQFFEPARGVGPGIGGMGQARNDGVDGIEQRGMGLGLGKGFGDSGEADAGASELAGALGDATGSLAHEGLTVE